MDDIKGKRKRIPEMKDFGDSDSSRLVDFINCLDDDSIYDLSCPICLETIEDAQVTTCGHSFCSKCIYQSFKSSKRCPACSHYIDKVFPNFLLNEILMKKRTRLKSRKTFASQGGSKAFTEWKYLISMKANMLTPQDIDVLLTALIEKKRELAEGSKTIKDILLQGFLKLSRKRRHEKLVNLISELQLIEDDVEELDQNLGLPVAVALSTNVSLSALAKKYPLGNCVSSSALTSRVQSVSANSQPLASAVSLKFSNLDAQSCAAPEHSSNSANKFVSDSDATGGDEPIKDGCNSESHLVDKLNQVELSNCTMSERWVRMRYHLEDLEELYLPARVGHKSPQFGLDAFKETLVRVTYSNTFKTLASLTYASDPTTEPSIVSHIAFDKDNEIFAAGGVTKLIKLYDFSSVVKDNLISNYPIGLIECKSKVSCVAWSPYFKNLLGSSEYEGSVNVWDVSTKQTVNYYKEHERRVWSVDFNKMDTNLIASGSDDGTAKLWSLNLEASVATIKAPANICAVRFNPRSRYHIGFASANHCFYYYDLRNTKEPMLIFKGHRKAVSCATFTGPDEVVTSSTDGQLKLWSISKNTCVNSFKGHVNDKNFVGLAADGNYICCGSENNAIYLYYKGFHKPILVYAFEPGQSFLPLPEKPKNEFLSEFVGAVAWKGDDNIVVAANSQGIIKVLELC